MKPSNNLENKGPLGTYWKVQLICKNVQTRSSLEPPLDHMPWFVFLTILGVKKNIKQFQISSRR